MLHKNNRGTFWSFAKSNQPFRGTVALFIVSYIGTSSIWSRSLWLMKCKSSNYESHSKHTKCKLIILHFGFKWDHLRPRIHVSFGSGVSLNSNLLKYLCILLRFKRKVHELRGQRLFLIVYYFTTIIFSDERKNCIFNK
jgi:hypothetical protein